MTILEEVIMYTFQQCVYYITKVQGSIKSVWRHPMRCYQSYWMNYSVHTCMSAWCFDLFSHHHILLLILLVCHKTNKYLFFTSQTLYVVLPGLLDCNPFGAEPSSEQCRRAVGVCVCAVCVMPEAVRRVVSVLQTTADLLQQYQVHSEIQSQMFAYLFFFTNVSLFNQLIDKGLCYFYTYALNDAITNPVIYFHKADSVAMETDGRRYGVSSRWKRRAGLKYYMADTQIEPMDV